MVRRFQLMEPERGPRARVTRAMQGLREGLLRDNKVIPPVLGALALIIFAWIVAGALIGDPGGEDRRQVANQANQPSGQVAQNPNEGGGASGTPAPSVENRDTESFAAYESKDPFRELFPPPADEDGDDGGTDDDTTGGGTTDGGTTDDDDTTDGGAGDDQYGDGGNGGDFMDQTFPGDPGFGGGGGGGTGDGGADGDQYGGGGGDDLFDSGGELRP